MLCPNIHVSIFRRTRNVLESELWFVVYTLNTTNQTSLAQSANLNSNCTDKGIITWKKLCVTSDF